MRMTRREELRREELRREVESKLNQFEGSYVIANFETVHKVAKKIENLGYTVTKTSENSYLIAR